MVDLFLFGVAAEGVRREVRFLVLRLRADVVVLVAMSLSFYGVCWMWISRAVALVYPLSVFLGWTLERTQFTFRADP